MSKPNFEQLDISPEIIKALHSRGYYEPTEVQLLAIPPLLEWRDLIAKAPTGTGKTFAFGIPILEHIDVQEKNVQALILAPTRELALQIGSELREISEFLPGIKVVCVYGGQPISKQIRAFSKKPQIVVATPGRLLDHINRRTISINRVSTAVLDEADRMLDMGFFKDVTRILNMMPNMVNLALLSATLSTDVMTIGWKYQRDAVEILVRQEAESRPDILQYSVRLSEMEKARAVIQIVEKEGYERSIVFCNTKSKVERTTKMIACRGGSVDCIHGDIRQVNREKVLEDFRKGEISILVATDVASRGLDIDDVDAVFNYDIPAENEYYVHRIGRTGRAKKRGVAYSFIASIHDSIRFQDIVRRTKSEVQTYEINLEK